MPGTGRAHGVEELVRHLAPRQVGHTLQPVVEVKLQRVKSMSASAALLHRRQLVFRGRGGGLSSSIVYTSLFA